MPEVNEQVQGTKQEFLKEFQKLCRTRQAWQAWSDLMETMACSISNAVDHSPKRFQKREERYAEAIKRLGGVEVPSRLFAIVVMALERNPDQDFLGQIYMELNLGSHWHGQFFTPYSVCQLMARVSIPAETLLEEVDQRHYVTVNDPACGAGATLIAAVSRFRELKIDQLHFLIAANDIDTVAAQMCYIQLSLLGAAGWVAIANTLSDPVEGDPLMPVEKESQEFYYTPMYFHWAWAGRRRAKAMDRALRLTRKPETGGCFFVIDTERKANIMADTKKYGTAVEKLEAAKKTAGTQEQMILDYLIGRAREDTGVAEDVMQEHKTFHKCIAYIFGKARKQVVHGMAIVKDSTVYEWAEDYYHMDDAEQAKKEAEEAKKAAEEKLRAANAAIAAKKGKAGKEKEDGKKAEKEKAAEPAEPVAEAEAGEEDRVQMDDLPPADQAGDEVPAAEKDKPARKKSGSAGKKGGGAESPEQGPVKKPVKARKEKKAKDEMDGQLDMFAFFGGE